MDSCITEPLFNNCAVSSIESRMAADKHIPDIYLYQQCLLPLRQDYLFCWPCDDYTGRNSPCSVENDQGSFDDRWCKVSHGKDLY